MPLETTDDEVPRKGVPATSLVSLPVLVVDDDAASNALILATLDAYGCRFEVVPSAEQALAALRAFRARVVVMDLVQPLMSGLLLAQRLKQNQPTSDIVLVALVGFGGPDSERVAREAGFAACAVKPVDPGAFARTLLAAVEAAR